MTRHKTRTRRRDQIAPITVVEPPQQPAVLDQHHSRADLRMIAQAARGNWMKGTRWPTDATDDDFYSTKKARTLTVKERLTRAALEHAEKSEDPRLIAAAMSALIAMEGQNQADELKQRRPRTRRVQPADSVGVGVAIGLGIGENIADAKREIAARIARLIGVSDDNSGNRIVVEQGG